MTLVRDLNSATDAVSSQNDQLLPSWREMPFLYRNAAANIETESRSFCELTASVADFRLRTSVMKRQRLRLAD